MKNLHTEHVGMNERKLFVQKRNIYFYGEAQQKAEVEKKLDEKKTETEENKPEKVNKLKTRYSGERTNELIKCDLLKNSDTVDPYEKDQAGKKEKRIKDETVEPSRLEGQYLTASAINDNMRKLYAIMGKDWDQVRAEEEQKAKDAEQKAKEDKDKKPAEGAKPDAPQPGAPDQPKPVESPDKQKALKFDSIQRLVTESIGDNPDAPTKEAADAVTKEVESKIVGKEFKNIDEIKTTIQLAVNNMDNKYLVALAGKEMKLKAGEYNISFRFVKPGESPNQKAGIENVTIAPEVKPKDPEKPAAPQPPEKLTRIKFSKLERQQSSVDKNADAKTKEATDAVMKAVVKDTMGIEFATTDEFLKAIKYAVNGVDAKHLNALAGKDLKFKAGEYDITFNIGYTLLTPGSAPTKPAEIKDIYIGKTKPVEAPKPQEAKDKKPDDKEKPAESKEVTELREDIKNKAKSIFEEYSKMSKEDLVKQGLNNGNKLSYEIGVRINNIGIQNASKLSGIDKTYFIDEVTPGVGKIGFGPNGVFVESLGQYINNLYKDKKIEDTTKKETPKAFEYLTQFSNKVNEITTKYEDKAYVTQLGVTTFEEYAKKYEQEVKTAVGTIDKKLISSIEWKKLEYKTLNNSISAMVYFRLEEGKDPQISPHLARLRAKWEALNPPAKEEPTPKEEPAKAPAEEKPDPAKFNKIRPSQEAAINRGLALSYEGTMYNDPIGIGIAVKQQLQKLPIQEQYLIPTHYMTLQGIKLQMLYYGEKMQVKVVGVTEKVAKKYVESWEKEPRATAEENEKKWAKIKCVDMYGTEKVKPEGWLKTKESFKLEKEAKEKAEAAKPKAEGADKPKEAPVEQESPEVKETRNKVETGMKKIFDKISKMSKEELSSKGVFNILHEMSLSVKTLEKDLGTDLAKLDKTYTSDKLQPPILIYFNKSGICMEKPGAWINSQFEDKGAIDTVDQKNPNAFNYTQIFTGKMVELRTKYSSKKFLTEQGITSPEDLSKKFNQEITSEMEKVDPKLIEKIEWANLPGQALVYPNYSYASFRLEKGKKISVNVNEAGMRTLFDKANAPKPAFEATSDEKAKEDAPEKIENAKTKVDQEVKDLLKKYQDMSASDITSKGFNSKLKLTEAVMTDLKALDEKLKPDLNVLERTYSIKPQANLEVWFNKYGLRPIGLDNWMNTFYKDKKVKNIESEKGQTPNARKAIDTIMKTMNDVNAKCNDTDYLRKANVKSFGDYYKLITDEQTKAVKSLDPKLYEQVEWDKLTDNTLRTPYTFQAEVTMTKGAKEPTLKFNYANIKGVYDTWHYDDGKESNYVDLNPAKPEDKKDAAKPGAAKK